MNKKDAMKTPNKEQTTTTKSVTPSVNSHNSTSHAENKQGKQVEELERQLQQKEKMIEEIKLLTGISKDELVPVYLAEKKKKLLKNFECIGDVMIKMTSFQKNGTNGIFEYFEQVHEKRIPVVPMAFPSSLFSDASYLTENNLFRIKGKVDMEMVMHKTTLWKVIVNTVSDHLKQEKVSIKEDDWDSLKAFLEDMWNCDEIQDLKLYEKKTFSRTTPNNSISNGWKETSNGMNSNGGHTSYDNNEQYMLLPLFPPNNNSFEECIWMPLVKLWKEPFEQSKGNKIGRSRDQLLMEQMEKEAKKRKIVEQGKLIKTTTPTTNNQDK